jgi:protein-L-isoaspartate(D-aspartate) O-methyltransferase
MNFQVARQNMVLQQVRPWSVLDTQVLDVLSEIMRENFVPEAFKQVA